MGSRAKKKISPNEAALRAGIALHDENPLFGELHREEHYHIEDNRKMGKQTAAYVSYTSIPRKNTRWGWNAAKWRGEIFLNKDFPLSPEQWAYTIAHCELHLAFGHFDGDRMPGYEKVYEDGTEEWVASIDEKLWNAACDIFIANFLDGIKFGQPTGKLSISVYTGPTADEKSIYTYLQERGDFTWEFPFGTGSPFEMDMKGLEHPAVYDITKNERNEFATRFALALAHSVTRVVGEAGGHDKKLGEKQSPSEKTAEWFINHYPLLGGLASGFHVIESFDECRKNEISLAAVNVDEAKIYVNPAAGLNNEELKFVLAHEFLHAGLQHYARCQGRDRYLWNVACDYVINGWLQEMHIGEMPERGELYDESLKGQSAEEIYDHIISDFRKFSKLNTFRGYGKGDIIGGEGISSGTTSLDDFYKSALQNGLEYHNETGRGYIPAGLVEEIRALSMPPIPWDVELGRWFDLHFAPIAVKRSYARPSRRQGSTPDIPRPRYVIAEMLEHDRTFGVVVDTSGSMDTKMLGYALGAIASYSAAREVPYARVVFCDANAYDAGYMAPEDIAGRVAVKGRGGTILQPGVDLLLAAKDFPKDAPILLITDGYIESQMRIPREHAFLIPKGHRLPFRAKGKMFYFSV